MRCLANIRMYKCAARTASLNVVDPVPGGHKRAKPSEAVLGGGCSWAALEYALNWHNLESVENVGLLSLGVGQSVAAHKVRPSPHHSVLHMQFMTPQSSPLRKYAPVILRCAGYPTDQ